MRKAAREVTFVVLIIVAIAVVTVAARLVGHRFDFPHARTSAAIGHQ
jgi:hypothetical protein